jgi:hypothetical protein
MILAALPGLGGISVVHNPLFERWTSPVDLCRRRDDLGQLARPDNPIPKTTFIGHCWYKGYFHYPRLER